MLADLDQLRSRLPARVSEYYGEGHGKQAAHAASRRLLRAACQNSGSSPAATWASASCTSTEAGNTKPSITGSAQAITASRPRAGLSLSSGRSRYSPVVWWKRRLPLQAALAEQQGGDEREHDAGDLRRAGQAVAVEPGVVDGDGQGAHAEELDRADVVQSFHQRERDARRERRPRQRKRHLARRSAAALRPSVRLTSSTHTDCARKLARAVM